MAQLQNLEGVKAEFVDCENINKGSDIKAILAKGLAATTADSNGAINIWKDDGGNIRCDIMRYCISQDKQIFTKMSDVTKWYSIWRKKIK